MQCNAVATLAITTSFNGKKRYWLNNILSYLFNTEVSDWLLLYRFILLKDYNGCWKCILDSLPSHVLEFVPVYIWHLSGSSHWYLVFTNKGLATESTLAKSPHYYKLFITPTYSHTMSKTKICDYKCTNSNSNKSWNWK